MNIFKVLASGKKSFQEETASAILAWFMNPTMEHGLGYSFLSKFIDELSISTDNPNMLSGLTKRLTPRLRNEGGNQHNMWSDLEFYVETALIDIVIVIGDWIFAIENKIYTQSVAEGQLTKEYEGLKKKAPGSRIGMIYLVPVDEDSEILDGKTENIFKELSVKDNDFKAIVTWQKNKIDKVPSISNIISKILEDESKGIIDPVSEYTRHTLKALNAFISNEFAGYEYEHEPRSTGLNPLTEERLSIDKLEEKNNGYVGVQGGIKGLLKMEESKIKSYKFQYTSQDMSNKRQWIDISTFHNIVQWLLYKEIRDIVWKGSLQSELLYKIAADYKQRVFIGIRGGEKALKSMDADEIKTKEWGISTEKATAQWIDGESFCNILDKIDVY